MLDVSMQFHKFLLDGQSQEACFTVTPFGKHECPQSPMGFLNPPSWAQAALDEQFSDMTDVEVHVNEIGTFSTNCELHVATVGNALH